ncbi:hypothetical protein COCCU_08335 [Corynebacterium occultum]|uniref:DUF4192 domain-containing protein n=2 Tax=Corynebacterium occultum TaxID=2675219 RepID=A0A6B8W4W6_9CORY|nr:hypothetical protein COCCU_08335 [Corynebacterium occultum]
MKPMIIRTMTSTLTQCTPAELLANLPGILGFFPRESLVLTTFNQVPNSRRYLLGPVMRLDLGDTQALEEVGQVLSREEPDLVFGFLISTAEVEVVEDMARDIFERSNRGLFDINACWTTREVLTGEPYQLVFGPGEEELSQILRNNDDWRNGRISPVSTAIAMEPLLRNGQLPELNRDDAFDYFNRFNPLFDAAEAAALESFAARHAADLCERIQQEVESGESEALGAIIADFALILEENEETGADVETLMATEEQLLTVAIYLSESLLRDAVLGVGLKYRRSSLALALAVARTFGGTIRANALSFYAVVAIGAQLSMQAVPALLAAQKEVPGHTLSAFLLDGAQVGAHDAILEATRRGSELVADKYRVPETLRMKFTGTDEPETDGGEGLAAS